MTRMDVVDLDALAAEQEAASAARNSPRRPRQRGPLRGRLVAGIVVGVLAMAALTGWAVAASRSPLSAQVLGMRGGPEIGWTLPPEAANMGLAVVDGDRVLTTDGWTVRLQRGSDGAELWALDQTELGLKVSPMAVDLPGTPWVATGSMDADWRESPVLSLLDRDTGRLAHTVTLPLAPDPVDTSDYFVSTSLFSATDGTLLLSAPTSTGVSVAKLNSPRADDVAWRVELPLTDEGFVWWRPQAVARGDYLLIGDANADRFNQYPLALRASDGEPAKWLPRGSVAAVYGEVAVVEGEDKRTAYDLATGEEIWRRHDGHLLHSFDGVIAEATGRRFALLSPRTGEELWSVPSRDEWMGLVRWGDDIIVYQGAPGLVSTDKQSLGAVAAFDMATGRERWRTELGATVADLARGEGQLVAWLYQGVSASEGSVDFETIKGGLVGLDPDTGRTRWDQGLEDDRWSLRFGTRVLQATRDAAYAFLR